jgi:hypothetical protein
MQRLTHLCALWMTGCLCVPFSHAQDEAPLSGPAVVDTAKPSLVEPGFAGMGEMPEDRPEVGAIRLLKLDETTQAAVDAVVLEHAAAVDEVLLEHVTQVTGWINDLKSEDQAARRAAVMSIHSAMAPVRALGPLRERLGQAMPSEQKQAFEQIVADHEQMLEDRAKEDAQAAGMPFNRVRYGIRRQLELVGLDIRSSYERSIASLGGELDAFLAKAELSMEGEAAVRTALTDLALRTELKPTPAQRQEVVIEVLGKLEMADRRKLVRALGQR